MLLEQELQHSLATSEEDAAFEEDDEVVADLMDANADAYAVNNQLRNGMLEGQPEGDIEVEEAEQEEEEDEELSDEDAEGEDDEMGSPIPILDDEGEDEDDEENEDGDEEGVGAVKIAPARSEDDDEDVVTATEEEEEEESVADVDDDDESNDSTDAEVEVQWEPTVEDAEEEEDPANPNRCMWAAPASFHKSSTNMNNRFCQQDEENDPSEEFELYLACDVCGDNGMFFGSK